MRTRDTSFWPGYNGIGGAGPEKKNYKKKIIYKQKKNILGIVEGEEGLKGTNAIVGVKAEFQLSFH